MKVLPKDINIKGIEEKWQRNWQEMGIYDFDWNDRRRSPYVIDTPPPYPSGDFHMGNVLNWTYFDMVARYKRMQGFNVLFPQGWDCHGLPTEVETEKQYKIRKTEVSPDQFRRLCEKLVNKYIGVMKKGVIQLGCSTDWTTEYKTMDSDYWRRTQLSFILLYKRKFIYHGTYPINWCPRCETAIADAEVEYETRKGLLHYIKFPLNKRSHLTIATTRPELLSACVTVAVNPNDARYERYIGKEIGVPIANRRVKIIAEEMVDPAFGTGVVMICTYGDKEDVKNVQKLKLPVIQVIDEKGKMNQNAGKYAGMAIDEAKEAIAKDLKEHHILEKSQPLEHEVGVCWRCHTPIEILERTQWFMKTRILTDKLVKNSWEIKWYPDYMRTRLIDWAKSLDWDWVISRQRVFATPIPIWYCKKCRETILAKEDWVPIDPRNQPPKIDKCPKCNSSEFIPETDVLDTWFDSSITVAVHAGWPDREDWRRFFPADLHPSGTDIIRTWAYYLMVRNLALFGSKPFKSVLINGMVLGSDGRAMHKSRGNYIATPEVFGKYGVDATRQWAAGGGATGSDIPFRWADTEYGWRFLRKLWNAARFTSQHLQDYKFEEKKRPSLELLDKWLLSRLEKVIDRVTVAMEECQFNIAMDEIRNFTWHILCDKYIEAVKHRLYKPEQYGELQRIAAQYSLYNVLHRIIQLLAPIIPHITEEIYQTIYGDLKYSSIHVSHWPKSDKKQIDEEGEKHGDLIMAVIEEIRRDKAERKIPLNTPIKKISIYADSKENARVLKRGVQDIEGTCKTQRLIIQSQKGEGRKIQEYSNIRFTAEY